MAAVAVILGTLTGPLRGDDAALPVSVPERETPVEFGRDIQPILKRNCVACHNLSEAEAGLNLELPEPIRAGGDSGPAVVPGSGEESLLFRQAAHREESFMPPEDNDVGARNLSAEELGLWKRWIDEGAPRWRPFSAATRHPSGRSAALAAVAWLRQARTAPSESGMSQCGGRFASSILARRFEGHTGHVLGVSWHAAGRTLATCGADNAVKIWDARTGEQRKTIAGFPKELTGIDFLGTEDLIVIGGGDALVATRHTDGSSGSSYGGSTDFMYTVRASADGTLVVAGGEDGHVRVWKKGGQIVSTFAP